MERFFVLRIVTRECGMKFLSFKIKDTSAIV